MEKEFNEKESFQLINSMIAQARNNMQKGDMDNLLIWGYAVTIAALLNAVLLYVLPNPGMSFWVWLLMIPVGIISSNMSKRRNKKALIKTHIDTVVEGIWKAVGIANTLYIAIIFGLVFIMQEAWMFTMMITPGIMLFVGAGIYATATACKLKLFYASAYIFWTSALLCILLLCFYQNAAGQFFILALAMIFGFIIPSHKLNNKAK